MLVSPVFGMMVMILLHLCPGEDFRAQCISACTFTAHVQREESQALFLFFHERELTCPALSTGIKNYNVELLNPSPVLYWWCTHAVTMAASLWTCDSPAGDLKTPPSLSLVSCFAASLLACTPKKIA